MALHRKHFIALTQIFSNTRPSPRVHPKVWDQWVRDRDAITKWCQDQNPQFDPNKFIAACNKEDPQQ